MHQAYDPRDTQMAVSLGPTEGPMDDAPLVLCIDDDESVRRSTNAVLSSLGVVVETACDGRQGLRMLQEKEFSLVISDQGLPGMGGVEVLRKIKAIRPDLPVVIVSGWSTPKLDDDAPPEMFLEKPVPVSKLIAVLQQYVPMPTGA